MKNITLENIKSSNIFKVPEAYFDELSVSIENKIFEAEITSKITSKTVNFDVPPGYFDNLTDRILSKISQKQPISLDNLSKDQVFKVPSEYFKNLETTSHINSLSKENVFKVPQNYFESLSTEILSKTSEKKGTKVLKVNWWQNSKIMWSAAASIILVVGFLYMFLPNILKSDAEVALNKVSNQEIAQYLETQDLSQLEIEAVEVAKITTKESDNQLFEHLEINEEDIIQHLESENLEEI